MAGTHVPPDLETALSGHRTGTHPLDEYYAKRTLGLDPLDKLNQTTGNASTTDRGGTLKLKAGERRPCCFNRNHCCETWQSKNGYFS